jgi:multiple sugar transport system substrate-binding protein
LTTAGRPLRGVTWDHPRGYAALAELQRLDEQAATRYGAVPAPLTWERQPLTGFESEPIAGLAGRYDVLVVDHPGIGAARAALRPLDEVFTAVELAGWEAAAAGSSFGSYRYAGRQWALPLDAAAQVCVTRPDLTRGRPAPRTWQEVAGLARELPVALVLGGPHALLTVLAICVAQGAPPVTEAGDGTPAGGFADDAATRDAVLTALGLLADLSAHADLKLASGNPVDVLEAMAAEDAAACCPLVYGYVTYSAPGQRPRLLAAHNAPSWQPAGCPGSVLGGAGVAISRRVGDDDIEVARAHLRRLLAGPVQADLVPRAGGQPALRAAWQSAAVNAACGNFYQQTLATLDQAWVRPRYPGWIAFQQEGSAVVREGLRSPVAPRVILGQLQSVFRARCLAAEAVR